MVILIPQGVINEYHPLPYTFDTIEDAHEFIEGLWTDDEIDRDFDRILIYELPEEPGRAQLIWHFTGTEWLSTEPYAIDVLPQGTLTDHELTLAEEFDVYDVDQALDNDLGNQLDAALEADLP